MSARKSDKQRRAEIKEKRLAHAARLQSTPHAPDVRRGGSAVTRRAAETPGRGVAH